RARCLLAWILVNFLLPTIVLVPVHLLRRPTSSSTSEPPAIAAIAAIHTTATTGIRQKDAAVADDIRLTQLLWCKSMVAACRLQPDLAENATFMRTWAINATRLLGYRNLMGTSQYAELERLGLSEKGLWCDPWDYCKPSPKAPEQKRRGVADASSAWKQEEAVLHFLDFAERLDRLQWQKVHTVTLLNAGLDLGLSVGEAWVKRTIILLDGMDKRRKDMQKGSREVIALGSRWSWPFAASIGTVRLEWTIISDETWQRANAWIWGMVVGEDRSMAPSDAILSAATQSTSRDWGRTVKFQESVDSMRDMVEQDGAQMVVVKDRIISLLTNHRGKDHNSALETWLGSVADEVVGNLTTWHVWDQASAGLKRLAEEIDSLSRDDARRSMRWQERYVIEDSEWWKRAIADGRL
ncbi:hypothetical protein AC579_7003, partial [Pseudocercospora musae]